MDSPPPFGLAVQDFRVLLIMGPAGVGKTTVGRQLASELGWPFYDGDDYQPKANIVKMAQGLALNDLDRLPWLRALHDLISGIVTAPGGRSHGVVACSALKQSYRDVLRGNLGGIGAAFLKAPRSVLEARLKSRTGHFFKPDLLTNQLEILEEPEDALALDATLEPKACSEAIRRAFRLPAPAQPAEALDPFGGNPGRGLS